MNLFPDGPNQRALEEGGGSPWLNGVQRMRRSLSPAVLSSESEDLHPEVVLGAVEEASNFVGVGTRVVAEAKLLLAVREPIWPDAVGAPWKRDRLRSCSAGFLPSGGDNGGMAMVGTMWEKLV